MTGRHSAVWSPIACAIAARPAKRGMMPWVANSALTAGSSSDTRTAFSNASRIGSGVPARPTKPIEGTSSEFWVEQNPPYYRELARRHVAGVLLVEES